MLTASAQTIRGATAHLRTSDPVMGRVIDQCGPCIIVPHRDYFRAIVQSIIGQQLSVKAAASINVKFVGLFNGSFPSPAQILSRPREELRAAGLSRAKTRYISELAQHVMSGTIAFDRLDNMQNEEIITLLTAANGIGVWTVHMFLIFCMGRLDVLPTGDLGIRNGVRTIYRLEDTPSPAEVSNIAKANNWHPYETVASWYVWESQEFIPPIPNRDSD